jgi:hypothetical protein
MSYAPGHPETGTTHQDTAFTGSDLSVGSVLLGAVLLVAGIAAVISRLVKGR